MDGSRSRGARAEELCADYLRGKGYRIVARNYRCRGGEIDIIAEQNTAPAPLRLLGKRSWKRFPGLFPNTVPCLAWISSR